jgi:anaerobic ribonucleoside-triphosphate reductase activating protein
MRIADVISDSIVDGPGLRMTVFTQGCPHRCPGCHNPQTHDPNGGMEYSIASILAFAAENPLLDGLTLSGGEPFAQAADCAALARGAHEMGLNIWCYTGYTYEELLARAVPAELELLNACDVLIDGPFLQSERSLELHWRGSKNQRIIDLNATRRTGRTVVLE